MKTWKLTARDLCRKPDMVVKDPPEGRGALGMQVILYPRMDVAMVGGGYSLSPSNDEYRFKYKRGMGFVCVYGLAPGAPYPSEPNKVLYQGQTSYLAGGASTLLDEDSTTDMALGEIPYVVPWTAGAGKMLVWTGIGSAVTAVTFEDTRGNRATTNPMIVLEERHNRLVENLRPDVAVELVRSTADVCTLRLRRSHVAPATAEFSNITMSWYDDANVSLAGPGVLAIYADPADPLNDDKLLVDCVPGVYTFGVLALYESTPIDYSNSYVQCVVEVM